MSDTIDDDRRRRESAVAQLAAVYVIGSLTLPVGSFVFVTLLFGGVAAAGLGLLLLLAGAGALIFLAGTATRHAGPAIVTAGRRFWWAVAVTVAGAVGLAVSAGLTTAFDVEYGRLEPWILAAGLPYLLVAAFFLGRRVRLVAMLVAVTLSGGAAYALHQQMTREHAETQRTRVLALLQDPVDVIWTVEIPGYRGMVPPISATTAYEPVDQATVKYWRERDIVVTVSHTAVQGRDCGPDPLFIPAPPPDLESPDASTGTPAPARPSPSPSRSEVSCELDGDLQYRRGAAAHEYVRTVGDTVVRAAASTVVAKALLKEAVLSARPLTVEELEHELFGS